MSVGEVFNIGSQEKTTVNELAELLIRTTGSPSQIVHVPNAEAYAEGFEEMQRRFPRIEKIQDLTGWRPMHTLEDIIDDVVDFERGGMGARSLDPG